VVEESGSGWGNGGRKKVREVYGDGKKKKRIECGTGQGEGELKT